jgi:hypothetical protein
MKKLLIGAILLFSTISCGDKIKTETEHQTETPTIEKTAIELEDESIEKGTVLDSTLLDFIFGMRKDEVTAHCKKLKTENIIDYLTDGNIYYAVETTNFKKVTLSVKFYYDNENKLFRIIEQPVMLDQIEKKKQGDLNVDIVNELLTNYKRDFGNKPLTNGTQPDAKFYWLKGDKRFDFVEADSTCLLSRTKISSERKVIKFNMELYRKQQEEINKKQIEETLRKEELANIQMQEEANIIAKLKIRARRDWPDDYTTQEFWINEQIDAYHYMLTIPNNDRIKKKAQRDWPLDFSTQRFWYNEQIQAKERLK